MAFRDWESTAAANLLELPIKGKIYRIPPMGYLDALRWREEWTRLAEGEKPQIPADEVTAMLLGADLAAQMRADNVPERAILHAATVAGVDHSQGREAAEQMWENGPDPEALAVLLKLAATALASSTTSPDTQPTVPTSSTTRPASTASTRRPTRPASSSTGTKSSRTRSSSPRTSKASTASRSTKRGTRSPGGDSPTS